MITFWRTLEVIRKFAGDDIEKAVVNDEIIPRLLNYDLCVIHSN